MYLYSVIGISGRTFGVSGLINEPRPDKNYGHSYLSLTIYLGCSRFSGGKEIINWERKTKEIKFHANSAL